jgi:hypothetical protein
MLSLHTLPPAPLGENGARGGRAACASPLTIGKCGGGSDVIGAVKDERGTRDAGVEERRSE